MWISVKQFIKKCSCQVTSVVLLGNMASSLALQIVFLLPKPGRAQVQFPTNRPWHPSSSMPPVFRSKCNAGGRAVPAARSVWKHCSHQQVKLGARGGGGGAEERARCLGALAALPENPAQIWKLITNLCNLVGNQLPPLACADTRH